MPGLVDEVVNGLDWAGIESSESNCFGMIEVLLDHLLILVLAPSPILGCIIMRAVRNQSANAELTISIGFSSQ